MKIKISEITNILRKKIANYHFDYQNPKFGSVISVGDGIALVQGLNDAKYMEIVTFENAGNGLVFNLEENHVGVIIFEKQNQIQEKDRVETTGKIISIDVGTEFLGRVIDPLGKTLDSKPLIKSKEKRVIENVAPSVMARTAVNEPLETGSLAVDALLPIGKGQRELIIGDRQTGKTSLALDAIINQKNKDVVCIYVSIGQKSSSVLRMIDKLKKNGAFSYTTVVVALSSATEAMKFIAPFSGMTHAEYYLDQGKDVLIVFDDLSKHAIAYRGLSLLLRRTPGRQAYPGDIFYLHSRLLERAAKLKSDAGGGSITALPIVETQLEDLTAYIPTNIISITDGQIFLINELFNLGFKPAIDYGLSVSRVGSTAQIEAIKKTVGSLKLDMAEYKELKIFSQFGGNLDTNTNKVLEHGNRIIEILKQKEFEQLPQWMMVIILLSIKEKLIDQIEPKKIVIFRKHLIDHFMKIQKTKWLKNFIDSKKISDDVKVKIVEEIEKVISQMKFLFKSF